MFASVFPLNATQFPTKIPGDKCSVLYMSNFKSVSNPFALKTYAKIAKLLIGKNLRFYEIDTSTNCMLEYVPNNYMFPMVAMNSKTNV